MADNVCLTDDERALNQLLNGSDMGFCSAPDTFLACLVPSVRELESHSSIQPFVSMLYLAFLRDVHAVGMAGDDDEMPALEDLLEEQSELTPPPVRSAPVELLYNHTVLCTDCSRAEATE